MPEAWKDRRAAGRDLRKVVPRSAHAEWAPPADRPDPVSVLAGQDTTRGPELLPVRYGRMATSAFAFFRGAAAIMAVRSRGRARDRPPGRKRAATRTSPTSASSPRPDAA